MLTLEVFIVIHQILQTLQHGRFGVELNKIIASHCDALQRLPVIRQLLNFYGNTRNIFIVDMHITQVLFLCFRHIRVSNTSILIKFLLNIELCRRNKMLPPHKLQDVHIKFKMLQSWR